MIFEKTWFKAVVLALSCLSFVILAWMTARSLEPNHELPASIFQDAAVQAQDGAIIRLREWQGEPAEAFRRQLPVIAKINELMTLIGPLRSPLILLIDERDVDRFLIGANRIEIGRNHALAHGQLARAVFKCWLRQNSPAAVAGSTFTEEIIADFMLAAALGDFELQDATTAELVSGDSVYPWPNSLYSKFEICERGWAPAEMTGFCRGLLLSRKNNAQTALDPEVSPMALRPLLTGVLSRYIRRISISRRIGFLQSWSRWLSKQSGASFAEILTREDFNILNSREIIRDLAKLILEGSDSDASGHLSAVLTEMNLQGEAVVDLEIKIIGQVGSIDEYFTDFRDRLSTRTAFIVLKDNKKPGVVAQTGLALVDGQPLKTRHLVLDLCRENLTVGRLLHESRVDGRELAAHVVVVSSCALKKNINYESWIADDFESFLKENPTIGFVRFHPASIELAVKRGLNPDVKLVRAGQDEVLHVDWPPQLEKTGRDWTAKASSYRLLAPVEILDWYRAGPGFNVNF